jgi:hypothetical protein
MSDLPLDLDPNLALRIKNATLEIANEYNRLSRQIEKKTQQLDSLLAANGPAGPFPMDFAGMQNRRYNIDFVFEAEDQLSGLPQPLFNGIQEKGVTIESGTIFRCAYVESFVRAIGTGVDRFSGLPTVVQATLSWDSRLNMFDFMWRLRDTGTDREWTNLPQPSLFLGGGYLGPLWLPRRVVLGGGTQILAEVAPFLAVADTSGIFGFFFGGSVTTYELHMSFVGHEEPDRSAP